MRSLCGEAVEMHTYVRVCKRERERERAEQSVVWSVWSTEFMFGVRDSRDLVTGQWRLEVHEFGRSLRLEIGLECMVVNRLVGMNLCVSESL